MPPVSEVDTGPIEESSGGLTRSDCVCPICLDIFLEPVTLPCTHTFCKPCFLETVDKSNICCPLCRKRVSTWARLNNRNKTLVNIEFWGRIQNAFPEQCERRLRGIDDDDVDTMIPRPRVCQPGEVRREYEDQISKLVEEKRALEEAERRASEEYIQRLLAEEEEPLAEARRRQEEQQLENDERLARLLSQELNSVPVSESSWNIKPVDATPLKKKKTAGGDIEKFLRPVPHKQPNSSDSSPDSSIMANKENILNNPKTIQSQPEGDTIPVLDYYGKPSTSNSSPCSSEQTFNSPNNTTPNAKRKSSEIEVEPDMDLLNKRPCADPLSEPIKSPILTDMVCYEEAMRIRWQQEEEDRRMAMRLQKELNRDSAVDRRKGSVDGYQLRQKISTTSPSSNPDEESSRKNGATRSGRKLDKEKTDKKLSATNAHQVGTISGKSPISSPTTTVQSTPLKKGTKQTTLTEMFTNMTS